MERKRGRPTLKRKERISFFVDIDNWDKFKEICYSKNITAAEELRKLINAVIKKNEKKGGKNEKK